MIFLFSFPHRVKLNTFLKEALEWFYLDQNNEYKGPLSERDLDVLWRTSSLFSTTMLWKNGMESWKPLKELPDLRDKLMGFFDFSLTKPPFLESTKELLEISHKQNEEKAAVVKKPTAINEENDIDLDKEVEKLIENSTYKSPTDGLWYIYDHEKKTWRSQDEDPNAGLNNSNKKSAKESIASNSLGLLDKSKKINKPAAAEKPVSEEELVGFFMTA